MTKLPMPRQPRVDRVGHTWTEGSCPRVAHVALTWQHGWPFWPILPSRAPYAFFDRFWASELRF